MLMEKYMKKWFRFAYVLAFIAVFGFGTSDAVKIGFVGPVSGSAAQYGKLMSQAARLAADEKNAVGGIGGKKIAIIVEDDELNAYAVANMLINAIEKVYNESSEADKKAWNLDHGIPGLFSSAGFFKNHCQIGPRFKLGKAEGRGAGENVLFNSVFVSAELFNFYKCPEPLDGIQAYGETVIVKHVPVLFNGT